MTPEQKDNFWELVWKYESTDIEDDLRGVIGNQLDAELSHYVRVPEPTPVSERRCGGCVYSMDGLCSGIFDEAVGCRKYREPGALPEGIAAVIRWAVAQAKATREWNCADDETSKHKFVSMDDARLATERAAEHLSPAELSMAGVKGGERG